MELNEMPVAMVTQKRYKFSTLLKLNFIWKSIFYKGIELKNGKRIHTENNPLLVQFIHTLYVGKCMCTMQNPNNWLKCNLCF